MKLILKVNKSNQVAKLFKNFNGLKQNFQL